MILEEFIVMQVSVSLLLLRPAAVQPMSRPSGVVPHILILTYIPTNFGDTKYYLDTSHTISESYINASFKYYNIKYLNQVPIIFSDSGNPKIFKSTELRKSYPDNLILKLSEEFTLVYCRRQGMRQKRMIDLRKCRQVY